MKCQFILLVGVEARGGGYIERKVMQIHLYLKKKFMFIYLQCTCICILNTTLSIVFTMYFIEGYIFFIDFLYET